MTIKNRCHWFLSLTLYFMSWHYRVILTPLSVSVGVVWWGHWGDWRSANIFQSVKDPSLISPGLIQEFMSNPTERHTYLFNMISRISCWNIRISCSKLPSKLPGSCFTNDVVLMRVMNQPLPTWHSITNWRSSSPTLQRRTTWSLSSRMRLVDQKRILFVLMHHLLLLECRTELFRGGGTYYLRQG